MARKVTTGQGANPGNPAPAGDDWEERVRRRAYELYEQEGREQGRCLEHWLQAQRELAGEPPQPQTN